MSDMIDRDAALKARTLWMKFDAAGEMVSVSSEPLPDHDAYISYRAIRAIPAAEVGVKPLDLSEPSFVIHASGHFTFFASAYEAENYADSLGRYSYPYDADALQKYGERLKSSHDEWASETQKLYAAAPAQL